MEIYFYYVLTGLVVALPVGAMTVEMTKQGLKNGFIHGWAVGLGGMTMDAALIIALYLGLASILALPYVQLPLWIIGALFLLYLAYDSIKNADKDITLAGEHTSKSFWSTYKNGLLVAVSPGNLVFWVSVFGAILAKSYSTNQFGIAGVGILTGILLHDVVLLALVSVSRRAMDRQMIKNTSIIAGILLIGFALYFVYEFIRGIQNL
ncbi:MAG: LysE family transporter [Kurthia sp.]|nr:LysE family transporter [Candidatus Kurthia equi]